MTARSDETEVPGLDPHESGFQGGVLTATGDDA